MVRHFEDLKYGMKLWLWREGNVIVPLVVIWLKTPSTVSRPVAMLDEVTTPSPAEVVGCSCGRVASARGENGS